MDSNGPTRQSIGARVRMARQQAALRQEDIARHLGIPRPSVSEIENGRRELTSVELTRLAALVGKPLAWFVAGDKAFDAKAWDPAGFRLRGGALSDADRNALLAFATRCHDYVELERLLDLPRPEGRPRYGGLTGLHMQQGRMVALQERRRLGLGRNPVGDIVGLLELRGVKVLDWPMPPGSEIDGALFVSEETGPCVLVNEGEVWARRHFTVAHEYAHLLLDVDGERAEVCYRGSRDLAEVRANAFAAEFLSPAEGVTEFLGSLGVPGQRRIGPGDALELQRYFQLSYQATLWRLLNLGLIGEQERAEWSTFQPSALARMLGREPNDFQPSGPTTGRFRELAFRAWQAGRITRRRLAELLGVSKDELARVPPQFLPSPTA